MSTDASFNLCRATMQLLLRTARRGPARPTQWRGEGIRPHRGLYREPFKMFLLLSRMIAVHTVDTSYVHPTYRSTTRWAPLRPNFCGSALVAIIYKWCKTPLQGCCPSQVISDLLKPERQNLVIREDKRRGVYVDGLSEWVVRSPLEVRLAISLPTLMCNYICVLSVLGLKVP